MEIKQISKNEYEVMVYDGVYLHDDYLCGYVKRQPDADEESDLHYWMFYPAGGMRPLSTGDLRRIYKFTGKLNIDIN